MLRLYLVWNSKLYRYDGSTCPSALSSIAMARINRMRSICSFSCWSALKKLHAGALFHLNTHIFWPANKYPYFLTLSTATHMFIMTFSDALAHTWIDCSQILIRTRSFAPNGSCGRNGNKTKWRFNLFPVQTAAAHFYLGRRRRRRCLPLPFRIRGLAAR